MTAELDREEVLRRTTEYVRQVLDGDGTGHDWAHVQRVLKTAERLAQEEGADLYVVRLAALLHDVADWKFHHGDETAGPRAARDWLTPLGVDPAIVEHVVQIIAGLSFKGAGVATPMSTVEGQVVQDADRLDAIGAVGVARAFAYGGHKGQPLYAPDRPPTAHGSFAEYRQGSASTLNHFYEKLFLLSDRLNTAGARRIAASRDLFMHQFVDRFLAEWNAQD